MAPICRSRRCHSWRGAAVSRTSLLLLATAFTLRSLEAQTPPLPDGTSGSNAAALARAAQLEAAHQPEAAADLLRPIAARQSNDAAIMVAYGRALLESGRRGESEATFAHALAIDPGNISTNDAVGDVLLRQHQNPEAMDRYETVLASSPQDAVARRGEATAATELALIARREGHPEIALEVLLHACSRLPEDPRLLLDLGIEATELHRDAEAVQALRRARSLDPGDPTVLYALAHAEFDEQHTPDAERDFKAYLAARPGDASAHFGLGQLYEAEQRTSEARAEFQTSLRLEPKQTASYYELGQMDLEAHQDTAAKALFEKVLASDPNHAGALTGMGEIALRARQFADAEQLLARAEQADPAYAPPHYYRGLALARLGREQEAQKELHSGDSRPHAFPEADTQGAGSASSSSPAAPQAQRP